MADAPDDYIAQQDARIEVWFTSTQLKLLGNIHEKHAKDAGKPHVPLPGMDSISAMMEENLA